MTDANCCGRTPALLLSQKGLVGPSDSVSSEVDGDQTLVVTHGA